MNSTDDSRTSLFQHARRQVGIGLLLFFSVSGPLWAPTSPGWCKNNTIIAVTTNLAFGSFSGNDVGLINVDVNGNRSASGGVVLMGGTVSQGVFALTGCVNYSYAVVLPPNTDITSGTDIMSVTTFQSNPSGSGILDANGLGTLYLGAILNTGFLQPAGAYTGTYIMEVVVQ